MRIGLACVDEQALEELWIFVMQMYADGLIVREE